MEYLLVIPGRLNNLNDYIAAERTNKYKGAKMKADNEKIVKNSIRNCLHGISIKGMVHMEYLWIEKNSRRDKDNIAFAKKFIQDALVEENILENDGWKNIAGFSDSFEVDCANPRIEVLIREVEG